jgi:predicted transcriptional regulator YdeE
MEPKIITRGAFTVMGVQERFLDPEKEDPGFETIWMKRFMAFHDQIKPFSNDKAHYGVGFPTDEGIAIDYFAGKAVADVPGIPEGLSVREVPGGCYAVFECTVKTIGETYDEIFRDWLSGGAYEHDRPRPSFEYYPPDCTTGDSPVWIYIAIVKRET